MKLMQSNGDALWQFLLHGKEIVWNLLETDYDKNCTTVLKSIERVIRVTACTKDKTVLFSEHDNDFFVSSRAYMSDYYD